MCMYLPWKKFLSKMKGRRERMMSLVKSCRTSSLDEHSNKTVHCIWCFKISNPGKKPQVKPLIFTNKHGRKSKSTEGYLVFPKLGKPTDLKAVVYSDATYACVEDGSSHVALIIFVKSVSNSLAPVS